MVAHVDVRVLGVGDRILLVDRVHDGQSGVEQPLLLCPVERDAEVLGPHEGVEVAAVGDVVAQRSVSRYVDNLVERVAVRRHVLEGHRLGTAVAHPHPGRDRPRRGVEPDQGLRLGHLDHGRLDEDRRHADRPVSAHRQRAGDLDEQHAVVGVRAGRGLEDRPGHGRVAARLAHEQRAQVVAFRDEALPLLGHRRAGQDAHSPGDHPGGHALGVRIDGVVADGRAHFSSPRRR